MNKDLLLRRSAVVTVTTALVTLLAVAAHSHGPSHGKPPPPPPKPEWSKAVVVDKGDTGVSSPSGDGCPIESADGLSLFIASNRPGTLGGNDIWAADRASLDSPWQAPRNLGEPVNGPFADFCPTPVRGRWLFFVSERPGDGTGPTPCGGGDMYLSRQSPAGGWSEPVMLGCAPNGPNFPGGERSPSLVETWFGTFLFYSSNADGGDQDIYVSRMRPDGSFGPGKMIVELSTEYEDIMPNVRAREDGSFEIVYSSNRPTWGRNQPAFGAQDVYYSRSWWPTGSWSPPKNLGENVNTAGVEQRSTLSADGKRLYFGRDGDIYVSTRNGKH